MFFVSLHCRNLSTREKVELLHKLCHWRLELDDIGDLLKVSEVINHNYDKSKSTFSRLKYFWNTLQILLNRLEIPEIPLNILINTLNYMCNFDIQSQLSTIQLLSILQTELEHTIIHSVLLCKQTLNNTAGRCNTLIVHSSLKSNEKPVCVLNGSLNWIAISRLPYLSSLL